MSKTINREESIELFRRLMRPESDFRVLRLLGEAKLGKSHLVTKIFPSIARQDYRVPCAVLDLKSSAQTTSDILHTACSLLGSDLAFSGYYEAYQGWVGRPQLQLSGLQAILSVVRIQSSGEPSRGEKAAHHLTARFVEDLRCQTGTLVLLLFDSVDSANEATKDWLMDTFLVQLSTLSHVRVVVAGRAVPEASGSYAAMCHSYQLLPIDDEEAYVTYCHEVDLQLAEQSIRDFARACDYRPGMFVDFVVPKFARRGSLSV